MNKRKQGGGGTRRVDVIKLIYRGLNFVGRQVHELAMAGDRSRGYIFLGATAPPPQ